MKTPPRRAGLDWLPANDPLGAFCGENHVALEPASSGLLDDLDFAAKDVIDVIGSTTGFGQPDWLRTHAPADASALVIDRLLNAGARLVGRTISDELSYSLSGENQHYGTPANPAAAHQRTLLRSTISLAARRADRYLLWRAGWSIFHWGQIAPDQCGCQRAIVACSACAQPITVFLQLASSRLRQASIRLGG